jgi:hypothetical protein
MAEQSADIIHLFQSARKADVTQGLRLVKAFMEMRDPGLREAFLGVAERIAASGKPAGETK